MRTWPTSRPRSESRRSMPKRRSRLSRSSTRWTSTLPKGHPRRPGIPTDKLQEIIGHIGGEGALGRYAADARGRRRDRQHRLEPDGQERSSTASRWPLWRPGPCLASPAAQAAGQILPFPHCNGGPYREARYGSCSVTRAASRSSGPRPPSSARRNRRRSSPARPSARCRP